jgi:hypothetical protein
VSTVYGYDGNGGDDGSIRPCNFWNYYQDLTKQPSGTGVLSRPELKDD